MATGWTFKLARIVHPSFTAALMLLSVIVGFAATNASQDNAVPDCLNSDDTGGNFLRAAHPECKDDILRLSRDIEVQNIEKMLGIAADEITFIGCAPAPFQTKMVRTEPPFHFQILYHIGTDLKSRDFVAPIFHELGHVYQLRKSGSKNKLLQSVGGSVDRVELGADFLAGLAAHRLKMNPGDFETSLFLMGSYDSQRSDSHGRPEDRSAAFRYGYYSPSTNSFEDSLYADFQDNEFAQIMHSGAPR